MFLMKFGSSMYLVVALLCFKVFERVGGEAIRPGDVPFFATLTYEGVVRCGATLFTNRCLFTTCFCLLKVSTNVSQHRELLNLVTVTAGNGQSELPSGETRVTSDVKVHPLCDFNSSGTFYNYGVVSVDPFTLKPGYIEIVDVLAQKDHIRDAILDPSKVTCTALDFGVKTVDQTLVPSSLILRKNVAIQGVELCSLSVEFSNTSICTTRKWLSGEECNNRIIYGGPLMCKGPTNVVVGLLSARICSQSDRTVREVQGRMDVGVDWLKDASNCHNPTTDPNTDSAPTLLPSSTIQTMTSVTITPTPTGLSPGPFTIPTNEPQSYSSKLCPLFTELSPVLTNILIRYMMN